MNSLISAAAQSLAKGDVLRALNLIARNDSAPALALRGIAMARLGDLEQARGLLKRAERAFGPEDEVARARCVVAQAEIAFVSRDLGWSVEALAGAMEVLEIHGDFHNADHARHLQARRSLLLGHHGDAERILNKLDPVGLPPVRRAAHEMIVAGLAMRKLRIEEAREAFGRAVEAARLSGIVALRIEVEKTARLLDIPVGRQIHRDRERPVLLGDVESLHASGALIVDACSRLVRCGNLVVPLASRPVLFTICRALAEAWPGDLSRESIICQTFEAKVANESHRARLRVEVGRLRKLLDPIASIKATRGGFVLTPVKETEVMVLAWPVDEENAAVLSFLADGEAWSSSALAVVLGVGQRTVQRALDALATEGKVQWFGHGRARRWTASMVPGFTSILLLPDPLPMG